MDCCFGDQVDRIVYADALAWVFHQLEADRFQVSVTRAAMAGTGLKRHSSPSLFPSHKLLAPRWATFYHISEVPGPSRFRHRWD
jgi:hypothetical protein